jgi:dipeptidyl aminopeptidase/acylaminoacyl peptidase
MTAPLTPETLVYGFTTAGSPEISPDGSRVAYVLSSTSRETAKTSSQLWLATFDGGAARRLTWSGERNHSPRWSPDGSQLLFVSDRVPANGLFVLPLEGGEARELLRHPTAISDPAWSPDGRQVAFVAPFDPANPDGKRPAEAAIAPVRVTSRIDYKQDNRGYLGDVRTQVYVAGVEGGQVRRLTTEAVDHLGPAWSPDGQSLLTRVTTKNGMCSHLVLIPASGGPAREITPPGGAVSTWAWSPSGGRIAFSADPEHTSQTDWFTFDVGTGQTRRVTDDLQCLPDGGFPTILPPSQPVFLDEDRLLFHAFRGGASGVYTVDLRSGAVDRVEGEMELRSHFSVDAARRRAVQAVASLSAFGEVAVVDLRAGERRLVTEYSRTAFEAAPPARWERFDVSRDGFTTEAWLLLPPGFDPGKRYPLVLDVHGGPNGYYGYGFNAMQQCLATNDIAVVYSNPRGSSSYGRRFTEQVFGDWGGEDFLDLMAVVDRALERPYLDRERTGIWGYSYGGYMTAWTIARTQRFKAAVCGAPCFDVESMFGTSDIAHFFGRRQWLGAPHEQREWYATHSPSQFAHNTRTPTLIVHGEGDERCPIGQGEQMFVALKEAGCEVEFARYPGQSHLFLRNGPPEYRLDALQRVLAWFKRHLGDPA